MTTRASAGFDAMVITDRLTRTEGGATPAELHVFSYLACLMSMYEGKAPEQWAYGFAATPAGSPYALVLSQECDRLRAAGRLLDQREVMILSERGMRELAEFRAFPSFAKRERYLEAACASTSLLPLPAVAGALSCEPQLQRALKAPSARELFKSAGNALVNEHFRTLSDALRQRAPDTADLLVATTVWLTYLLVAGREAEFGS